MAERRRNNLFAVSAVCMLALAVFMVHASVATVGPEWTGSSGDQIPWWGWTLLLFVFTFLLGIAAVIAGVGGGVLFVPIIGSFFPFNLDFVRGAGLLVALSGALSASPSLLRAGFADLKLGMPFALVASVFSIAGAWVGLALPERVVQLVLGAAVLLIVLVMLFLGRSEGWAQEPSPAARFLRIGGSFYDPSAETTVNWAARHIRVGLVVFALIGFMAGLFGLGAGWANVPALQLLVGVPLKVAVGTSAFIIFVSSPAAALVYLNAGAVLPLVAVPSVAGMMLGTRIGAGLLAGIPTRKVRLVVIVFHAMSGIRALLKGFGLWL
jgi:uncharacterized protein